jgi:formyl-CoA transferase
LADLAAEASGRDLEAALEKRIANRSADHWITILRRSGVAAERVVLKLTNLIDDPLARAQGLVVTREHDVLGLVTTAGPGIKLSKTPVRLGRPAPKPGADAKEILSEIAMEDELERLLSHRVVVTEGIEAGGAS